MSEVRRCNMKLREYLHLALCILAGGYLLGLGMRLAGMT